jgi:uncharacterized protein (TIGR02996 family)
MMHPEERGLLDAIIEAPADDVPRLIYADWLLDRGGEADARRAHRIHRLCTPQRRHDSLEIRYDGRRGEWLLVPGLKGLDAVPITDGVIENCLPGIPAGVDGLTVIDRRGFAAEVRLPLEAWREHGPCMASLHPLERVEPKGWHVTASAGLAAVHITLPYPGLRMHFALVDAIGSGGGLLAHSLPGWATIDGQPVLFLRDLADRIRKEGSLALIQPVEGELMSATIEKAARRWVSNALLAWARAEARKEAAA